jgi:hypothetical protein
MILLKFVIVVALQQEPLLRIVHSILKVTLKSLSSGLGTRLCLDYNLKIP